jgi:hypothetical protein
MAKAIASLQEGGRQKEDTVSNRSVLRQSLRARLPSGVCSNLKVSCGYRRKNKSCDCVGCGYNLQTQALTLEELAVLAFYTGVTDTVLVPASSKVMVGV